MANRYVTNADGKGWMMVRWDADASTFPPLPQHLKVDHTGVAGGRDRFTVAEGTMTGRTASVSLKGDGSSYLTSTAPPHTGSASVTFHRATKTLRWTGGPTITAKSDVGPLPAGSYDLELPYEAHDIGAPYESQTIFAKTWFRIGHAGDRFLHPGRVSLGCVTITDIPRWTDLYTYLIKARKGDGQSVGTITIV